jgi:tRNA U34 2-thiouridine synthase MnmA/TrmU
MRKAVVLYSGGLDSRLTLEILKRHGVEPIGLKFRGWFLVRKYRELDEYPPEEQTHGFTIVNRDISEEYTDLLLHPRFGRGSGANPCVDCKLLFLIKARELMEERGASFVATGEVLGQRPMSQRLDVMKMLEKRSGLDNYLLRPLSARLLAPTVPEELGWVDRERLYDIRGRSRKRQMHLARSFGIDEYLSPAGGCLLAEPNYGRRFADLIRHSEDLRTEDMIVLKYGRHVRLGPHCKMVIGKNQEENEYLEKLRWGNVTIDVLEPRGPYSRMSWDGSQKSLDTALEVIARYCSIEPGERTITFSIGREGRTEVVRYRGTPDYDKVEEMLIR